MQSFDLDIIGTHLSLQIDTSSSYIDEDFSRLCMKLQNFEQRFSRFIEGNWLYSLNQTRSGILDADATNMLSFALELAWETSGYFDPTVGKRLTELGYGRKMVNNEWWIVNSKIHSNPEFIIHWDYRDIEIQGDQVLLHGTTELEFGGVGKGYLIDMIRETIESWNLGILESVNKWDETATISRYLINFWGDLYGKWVWSVGLESPFDPEEIIGVSSLEDHCLACSAGTKRKWGDHHHLIDPHTGESARDVVATYIEGSSGIVTDGYATALSVMPWILACSTLERIPDIEWVLVKHDGILYQSKGSRAEVFT